MAQQPQPAHQPFTWEGDTTLHSYCYDYLRKRGWTEAASTFAKEAGIDERAWTGPPIEAPQGLLYEWWSVFWDVFIARSQKMGPRNANADAYVEAMRAKRDPLVVQFAGPHPSAPMNLPRSLAHPSRPGFPPTSLGGPAAPNSLNSAGAAGGPPRAAYGQMHVLEQQELQNQMQQQRGRQPLSQPPQQAGVGGAGFGPQGPMGAAAAAAGGGGGGAGSVVGAPSGQPVQRMPSNQPGQGYPPQSMAPSHGSGGYGSQQPPQGGMAPHPNDGMPLYDSQPPLGPLPPGSQMPTPQQQHLQHPQAMNGAQGSPHFGHAPNPHAQQQQPPPPQQGYANGRGAPPGSQGQLVGGPPPSSGGQQQQQQPQMMAAAASGGLSSGPSGAAVAPAFQAAMSAIGLGTRNPDLLAPEEYTAVVAQMRRMGTLPPTAQTAQMRVQQQQQQHQLQMQQQQQQQQRQGGGGVVGGPPNGPPTARVPIPQRQMGPQQQFQQLQQQQQAQQRGMPPPQYTNASSPASPAYSAPSPYTTPHIAHMQIAPGSGNGVNGEMTLPQPPPGMQGSPASGQFSIPLPPPSRGAGGARTRVGAGQANSQKGSPASVSIALAKRTGNSMDEPSPRTRKRPRAGTRDDNEPETPDGFSGAGSPAAMHSNGPTGNLPPTSQAGGPLFLPDGNGPPGMPYRASPSPSLGPPQSGYPAARSPLGGDVPNGSGRNPNGTPAAQNGHVSRPSSAASNHQYGGGHLHQQQSLGLGPPPSSQQGLSPSQAAQLQAQGHYASPPDGTPRPFAGSAPPPGVSSASSTPRQAAASLSQPESANATPVMNGLVPPPPGPGHQNAAKGQLDPGAPIDVTDDDVFAGLDFDSFLNENMFEDGPTA